VADSPKASQDFDRELDERSSPYSSSPIANSAAPSSLLSLIASLEEWERGQNCSFEHWPTLLLMPEAVVQFKDVKRNRVIAMSIDSKVKEYGALAKRKRTEQ
jgi:hypothetical protein